MTENNKALVWIRRSIRLEDHRALYEATKNFHQVYVCFVFDPHILDKLEDKSDHRVHFIYDLLMDMKSKLNDRMYILKGLPEEVIPKLAHALKVQSVVTHKDYEPYAKKRDKLVKKNLEESQIHFQAYMDHVLFESHEVRNLKGDEYKVFTPYFKRWLDLMSEDRFQKFEADLQRIDFNPIITTSFKEVNSLQDIGFSPTQKERHLPILELKDFKKIISDRVFMYKSSRDYPSKPGTTKLSAYLRMGALSVREFVRGLWPLIETSESAKTLLSEICWRDFYMMILDLNPHSPEHAIKPEFDAIAFENNEKLFQAWCDGHTGFPIVDAAMRELNQTGWMHNRARMIVASFLVKLMHIDWRWGEQYFAKKLIDYDMASNVGGWQWSASTGIDAAPYFRIFNPYSQSQKFDKEGLYIKKYIPELQDLDQKQVHMPDMLNRGSYPSPIIDYSLRREKALALYKKAKEEYVESE